jgi:hypothetical protein
MQAKPHNMEGSTPEQTQNPLSRFVQYYDKLKTERPDDFMTQSERRKKCNKVWYAAKRNDPEFMAKQAAAKIIYRASRSVLKKT